MSARRSPPAAESRGGCLVCHSTRVRRRDVVRAAAKNARGARRVNVCQRCGYIAIDEVSNNRYRGKTSLDDLPGGGPRIGTEDNPGREFQMARMALGILDRKGVDVLVYGAGRSMDNHHIQALPRVRKAAIGDIMKARDDAEFVDANKPARRKFGVVIASEVVEHFRNPPEDFAKLFQFVRGDGLLVCGTNINDGRKLSRHRYIFFRDHTSYYSPESLRILARHNGFHIDFRSPKGAGPRKRYVLMTRSPDVLERVACYFGTRTFAPSEHSLANARLPGVLGGAAAPQAVAE